MKYSNAKQYDVCQHKLCLGINEPATFFLVGCIVCLSPKYANQQQPCFYACMLILVKPLTHHLMSLCRQKVYLDHGFFRWKNYYWVLPLIMMRLIPYVMSVHISIYCAIMIGISNMSRLEFSSSGTNTRGLFDWLSSTRTCSQSILFSISKPN